MNMGTTLPAFEKGTVVLPFIWEEKRGLKGKVWFESDGSEWMAAYVRIQFFEEKMLASTEFKKMAEAEDPEKSLLVASSVGSTIQQHLEKESLGPENYELAAEKEFLSLISFLNGFSFGRKMAELVLLEHHFNNIKILLALKSGRLSEEMAKKLLSPFSRFKKEEIRKMVEEDFTSRLKKIYPSLQPLFERVELEALAGEWGEMTDTVLDHIMLSMFLEMSKSTGSSLFKEIAKIKIDFANLRLFVRTMRLEKEEERRIEELFVEGGRVERKLLLKIYSEKKKRNKEEIFKSLEETTKNAYKFSFLLGKVHKQSKLEEELSKGFLSLREKNSFAELEKFFDNLMVKKAKETKEVSTVSGGFSYDRMAAFVIGKLAEIKNFRIVMTGKLNRLKPEIITNLLRESYV